MSRKNGTIFSVLEVIAWIIFIGLCVETGVLLFNFIYGLFFPEKTEFLYFGTMIVDVREHSTFHYSTLFSLIILKKATQAFLFFLITKLMKIMDLNKPFSEPVYIIIKRISNVALSIGIICIIGMQQTKYLLHRDFDVNHLYKEWNDYAAFLIMSGIIFVIAKIFERGLELQSDNDLTI